MSDFPPFLRIDWAACTVAFDVRGDHVVPIWMGSTLPEQEDLAALAASCRWGAHESQADEALPACLVPGAELGFDHPPMVQLARSGTALPTRFRLAEVQHRGDRITLLHRDDAVGVELEIEWLFSPSGMVRSKVALANRGAVEIDVTALATLALPLPRHLTHLVGWGGRWAAEMQEEALDLPSPGGRVERASFGGRPGFNGAHWVMVGEEGAPGGQLLAAHLAWSGDGRWVVSRDADGTSMLTIGAVFDAGEISLSPGACFETPRVDWCLTPGGREAVRRIFHAHVRTEIVPDQVRLPRKVHLNSWEALGFDLDQNALCRLADAAAELGVERFVVDDGWFAGRRDDSTSLGDWKADPDRFPCGLGPLIAHVREREMDFGLWVEPEMVSPESALYRRHPDWCLHLPGWPRPTQRHQLVLDLSRREVSDLLFEKLDGLLSSNDIAYLKWDHNRPLHPKAGKAQAQVHALYALLDRLRETHPTVEIESCASGGGRIDLGILQRCTRVWASDNNDALERLRLNRSWLQFLPLAILGNHVGPSPNPVTGRRLSIDFRCKVAMFGHMGIEADPGAMTAGERACIFRHVALYKDRRHIIHEGILSAVRCSDEGVTGWLALHGGTGLALAAQTAFSPVFNVSPVCFPGLDRDGIYRVRLAEPWPKRAAAYLADPHAWRTGMRISGLALAEQGLALPLARPETAWLISFEREA